MKAKHHQLKTDCLLGYIQERKIVRNERADDAQQKNDIEHLQGIYNRKPNRRR